MSMSNSMPRQGAGGASANPASGRDFPTVSIYGIPFSKLNMADTVRYLTDRVERGIATHVVTGNPIMVMAALEDPAFDQAMRGAELVVPDGTGVVWAASRVGQPVAERVAGFDLMHELLKAGDARGWKVFLLGTSQAVIEETAARLGRQYPGVVIAGFRNGFFGPDEDEEVIAQIRAAEPELLFVARSVDTQEPWLARYKDKLNVPVMMGVGGSFDAVAGVVKRAPVLFQRLRLEWFYRLMKQPTRYKRMLALPKFAAKVMRDKENVTKHRPAHDKFE